MRYLMKEVKMQEKIIEFKNVSKRFPGVLANSHITMDIRKGEIFAIVGENGAGKSTLMKTMYGLHAPTEGEVFIRGKRLRSFLQAMPFKMVSVWYTSILC